MAKESALPELMAFANDVATLCSGNWLLLDGESFDVAPVEGDVRVNNGSIARWASEGTAVAGGANRLCSDPAPDDWAPPLS